MDDKRTQRYRPLAESEKTERGDKILNDFGEYRDVRNPGWTVPVYNKCEIVRPIPETKWREPVGEAGYRYPPGTVILEEGIGSWIIIDSDPDLQAVAISLNFRINWSIGLRKKGNRTIRHRVVDYLSPPLSDRAKKPETAKIEEHQQAMCESSQEPMNCCINRRNLELKVEELQRKLKMIEDKKIVYNGKSAKEWYHMYCQSALKEKANKPKADPLC